MFTKIFDEQILNIRSSSSSFELNPSTYSIYNFLFLTKGIPTKTNLIARSDYSSLTPCSAKGETPRFKITTGLSDSMWHLQIQPKLQADSLSITDKARRLQSKRISIVLWQNRAFWKFLQIIHSYIKHYSIIHDYSYLYQPEFKLLIIF